MLNIRGFTSLGRVPDEIRQKLRQVLGSLEIDVLEVDSVRREKMGNSNQLRNGKHALIRYLVASLLTLFD